MTLHTIAITWALSLAMSEGQMLTRGKGSDRTLKAGEAQSWEIDARADDFVHLTVEQRLIDVVITVTGPSGATVGTFDTPNGDLDLEIVRFIAPAPGRYVVEVGSTAAEAEPGRYAIRLVTRRPATPADRRVHAAIEAQADANRLRASPDTRRASLARYDEAMALWRGAGDRAGEANALRAMGFAHVRLREDDDAYTTFARTRQMWRDLGDVRSEAFSVLILGTIHARRGEPGETRARALEALPLWQRSKDREEEAFTLGEVGTTYARERDRVEVKRWFNRALTVARKARRPSLEAAIYDNFARAHQELGDTAAAIQAFSQGVELWEAAHMPKHAADTRALIEKLRGAGSVRLLDHVRSLAEPAERPRALR